MKSTLVMLLAGGAGSRLNVLGAARAKPAVPFGGVYRIIDFALSNAMNSGLNIVGVLTQYKPLSLMEHIGTGEAWDFVGRTRGAKILPPRTGQEDSDWYKGTADAVRQNIDFIESNNPDKILILSGDHIYNMDYASLIRCHETKKADLTIGMLIVPWEDTRHFGIAITDDEDRIIDWEEKPAKARNNYASMGIYVFEADYLLHRLKQHEGHDFGHNIIPDAIKNDNVFAYPFSGYWRDVGTIQAYWEANMDLLKPESGLALKDWGMRSNVEEEGRFADRAPAFIAPDGNVKNSILSPGCIVHGYVENSILSPGVIVEKGAVITDSVIMHNCLIHKQSKVQESILDKKVTIGEYTEIGVGNASVANRDNPEHLFTGLVVIGKGAIVPPNIKVGKNSILHPRLRTGDYKSDNIQPGETIRPMAEV